MLAPIVTKDMKLFQSKNLHAARIKNVRSRAQSLQDFANTNGNKQRVKVAPAAQRNAQSVDNLSLPLSRSPPKSSTLKKPLAAIAEGVELPSSSTCTASTPAVYQEPDKQSKPRSIALDDLRIISDKNFVDPTSKDEEEAAESGSISPGSGKTSPSPGKRLISKITSVFKSSKSSKSSENDDVRSTSPSPVSPKSP